ncbi:MAG: CaiB/BaiF CoA transferase family protein [Actinomycetota bacterium]
MGGLLEGVTVLDHSTVGPAARATAALRDLGATVIKIAAPASAARIEPPFYAYGAHRDIKRVRLDLKSADGVERFLALARDADAVVDAWRPGVADRLGVGYDACRTANPGIVYCAISGYGREGPYAGWAGHDINYLAVGGFLATQGRRSDGGPAFPGATIADAAAGGLQAALAIASALVRRNAMGEGAFLDVSTTDGVLHLMSLFVDEHLATGEEVAPGSALLTGKYACYELYEARDGRWLAVGAIEAAFFANLCRAIGCERFIDDQYTDERQDEIKATFRETFATRDRDDWVAELAGKDTCVSPVLSIAEVATDPGHAARGSIVDAEDAAHGRFRQVGPVLAGSARRDGVYRSGPEDVA